MTISEQQINYRKNYKNMQTIVEEMAVVKYVISLF